MVVIYLLMTFMVSYACVTNTGQVLFSSGSHGDRGLDHLHADFLEVGLLLVLLAIVFVGVRGVVVFEMFYHAVNSQGKIFVAWYFVSS